MAKYRKKPVVIDAWEYNGSPNCYSALVDMGVPLDRNPGNNPMTPDSVVVETLEGYLHVSVGDMIIKGVKGEFYPCKPDIFAATYDRFNGHEVVK